MKNAVFSIYKKGPRPLGLDNIFLSIFWITLLAGIIGNAIYAANVIDFLQVSAAERELVDKFFYALIPLFIVFVVLYKLKSTSQVPSRIPKNSSTQEKIFGVFVFSILSLAVPTNLFTSQHSTSWLGFGLSTAIVFTIVWFFPNQSLLEQDRQRTGKLIYWATFSVALILLFQPTWGLSDSFHSLYVLNDIMSPAFGSDAYVSQYAGLQGILISGWLKASSYPIQLAAVLLSLFAAISLLAYALTVRRILANQYSLGATLVAFTFLLSSNAETQAGSILHSSSVVGVRMLFPMLAFLFFALFINSFFQRPNQFYLFACGTLAGLGLVNNLEFGVAAIVALFAAFPTKVLSGSYALKLLLGIVGGSFLASVAMALAGVDFISKFTFISKFALGLAGSPFPIVGFHLFLFPFFAVSAILLFFIGLDKEQPETTRLQATMGVSTSVFGYLSLGYFVTVSSPSIQLQASFFALGLTGASLIHLRPVIEDKFAEIINSLTRGLLSLGVAIALTALPSMQNELVRISPNDRNEFQQNFSNIYLEETVSQILSIDKSISSQMALYVTWGNVVSSVTGVPSISVVTDARDEETFGFVRACNELSKFKYILAVRDHDGLPSGVMNDCGFSIDKTFFDGALHNSGEGSWTNDLWVRVQ